MQLGYKIRRHTIVIYFNSFKLNLKIQYMLRRMFFHDKKKVEKSILVGINL